MLQSIWCDIGKIHQEKNHNAYLKHFRSALLINYKIKSGLVYMLVTSSTLRNATNKMGVPEDIRQKNLDRICLPGQRLCISDESTVAGQGTYERQGYIYATLAGTVIIRDKNKSKFIEVKCAGSLAIIPLAGDIVTARIQQVNQRFAKCSIMCIGEHILERTYRGLLRKEDVRATEKDRVEIYKSFRPGDIILARVLPQTELSCYQLSTAENELGVVVAVASESGPYGVPMVPISWTEMQCPESLAKEQRKVAKIISETTMNNEN